MSKILCVGQIMIERQYLVDHIATPNEVSFIRKINLLASSKEINAARIIVKNNEVSYLACVGKDADGEFSLQYLEKKGINSGLISTILDEPTGQVIVITDSAGASGISVFVGANDGISLEKLSLNEYDFVYTSTANPLNKVYKLIEQSFKDNLPTLVDFPNKQSEFDKKRMKNISFVCPNRQEAGLLLDGKIITIMDAIMATRKLKQNTDGSVIITLDKDGCVAFEKSWTEPRHFPTKKISVVDMTASGDIFRGVFADQILNTRNFEDSIAKALFVATESCKIEGVEASIEHSATLI